MVRRLWHGSIFFHLSLTKKSSYQEFAQALYAIAQSLEHLLSHMVALTSEGGRIFHSNYSKFKRREISRSLVTWWYVWRACLKSGVVISKTWIWRHCWHINRFHRWRQWEHASSAPSSVCFFCSGGIIEQKGGWQTGPILPQEKNLGIHDLWKHWTTLRKGEIKGNWDWDQEILKDTKIRR